MRLRGTDVPDKTHRHAPITMALYRNYLENRQLVDICLGHALSNAALAGNPNIDLDTAFDAVHGLTHQLRSLIPYLTHGKTLVDEMEAERQKAVDQYHEYLKGELGEEGYHEYLKDKLGEEEYLKFTRSEKDGGNPT